jgi:N6-L-threonylcarbamoyladenine synthase
MLILGIETSCDETAAAVVKGDKSGIFVLSNVVSSQIEIHKKYHGVVPEIAAREHVLNVLPVINEALEKAGIKKEEAAKKLDGIAIATGPGLITSLLVGVETAKTLAYAWKLPVVKINHIEGHIRANFIGQGKIKLPAIILTVSGGHTMLILMDAKGKMKIIGDTRDDAAGEAFDKAAKLLGLGYPGGPEVSKKAAEFNPGENYKSKLDLPRPMINEPNFDFSFSGLKTALMYKVKKDVAYKERIAEYCYEFERAVVETLVSKAIKAAKKYKVKTIMLAGGVSANSVLRKEFVAAAEKNSLQYKIPELIYTTDNAAMVGAAGIFKARKKVFVPWQKLKADCNSTL